MVKIKQNTIFIIEDEIVNIEILKELLDDKYKLIIATNGKQAQKLLKKQLPDIILLDIMLPDIDGYELCKIFKQNDKFKLIPIIVITILDNNKNKIKALEYGANDYLIKPFDKDELFLKIKNHLTIKILRDEVNNSYENMVEVNAGSDLLMKNFNPKYFNFNLSNLKLIKDYISHIKYEKELPAFIMIAVKSNDNVLRSTLYSVKGNSLTELTDNLYLDKYTLYAINDGKTDVVFSNWDSKEISLEEYQDKFHPNVKKITGNVHNYISYSSKYIHIIAFNYKKPVNRFMAQVLKGITLYSNFFKLIYDQIYDIKSAYLYVLNSLARAAEASDELTWTHIIRVNHYSRFVAEKLNLPDEIINDIFISAQMHDIGKIHIHPDIIKKPGKLSENDWIEMKNHPNYGIKILGDSTHMKVARNICIGHHENYDGSGYPGKLKGKAIPLVARIVHLVDVYDSLRSPRVYKPEFSHDKTYDIIVNGDGRTKPEHFDPVILNIFKEYHSEFNRIYETLTNEQNTNE